MANSRTEPATFFTKNADRPFDMLAYGDPNIDYVFETARVPLADEKLLGRRLGTFAGGTAANVACAASRLGARVAGFGRVGRDADGQLLLTANEEAGISNTFLRVVEQPTAAATIIVDASGEKALVYAPMPGEPIDEVALSTALQQSRLLYAMPYDLAEFRQVTALARAAGVAIAIDIEAAVAPTRERLDALLECTDIVFMNEGGFRATSDADIAVETIRPLLDKGPQLVVVTMGAAGAIACSRTASAEHPAFPVKMVDATGAGDCFNGAFLAACFNGRTLEDSLAFACAAASIAVSAVGARTALPTTKDVESLILEQSAGRA
ncbi:carbohydrate kinase family protein [Rhizobium sp. AP16]|uniref:carbohydrate kinase family protein n=1 Tax=Rhizobium sp. AP16 TaxID=1144306 RepID=UPI00026EE3F4|nr:PfkB family carbohydrate kinase [Rhizobium sp. AP16]EJK88381.1 sugar kinase, ribokinase [Rhizobium sp. AP16]